MLIPLRQQWLAVCGLAAATALALPLAALPAHAEVIPATAMLRGITIDRAQCAAIPLTVWVHSFGRPFCVRYYLSNVGGAGARPVVYLAGDKLGRFNRKTRSFEDKSKFKDVDTTRLQANADAFSKIAKTTAIYLARIGIDGTSGHHGERKTLLELELMNAALDAIKRRYHFEGFHLAGQSGGSLLIGGLIARRDDIGCAVPGSGPLARSKPLKRPPSKPLDYFDASAGVVQIASHHGLRVLVLTDHADRQVPEARQTPFVNRLRRAGGRVDQFFGHARDELHHGMLRYARLAMAGCVLGASSTAIAARLDKLSAEGPSTASDKSKKSKPDSDARPIRRMFRKRWNRGARHFGAPSTGTSGQ